MRGERLESFLFLTISACLLCVTFGCAAERTGYIGVSQPRVWQDYAVVTTTGMQLEKIDKFSEKVDLAAIQGERARRYYQALALMGAFAGTVPSTTTPGKPTTPGSSMQESPRAELPEQTAPKGFPTAEQTKGLTFDDFSKIFKEIKEDPIDSLQRVDDFYQTLGGMRLTHLRDTASMQKGWSLYLLGFDISLVPGDKTLKDHGAYVELEIKGKYKDGKGTYARESDVRVYNVWPQRYAERFDETLSLREDFYLTLKEAAKGQQWAAQMAQNLAQRYEEDLALIQRYPLISGFVRGASCFGWEFNPRVRIETKERFLRADRPEPVYWLEPGMHQCYALLAVKDKHIVVDETLIRMGKEDLKKIVFSGKAKLMDIDKLKVMYDDVLKNVGVLEPQKALDEADAPPSVKEAKMLSEKLVKLKALGDRDKLNEWNKFEESLKTWQDKHDELIGLMDSATRANYKDLCELDVKDFKRIVSDPKAVQNTQRRYADALTAIERISGSKVSPLLENYFDTLDSRVVVASFQKEFEDFSEEFSEWEEFHRQILHLRGHHVVGGIKELELKVSQCYWFNRRNSGHVEVEGEILGESNTTNIELPDKPDRELVNISPVWPDWGPITQETTVTIKGENFSDDARVFVGGIEVKPEKVNVVGKDYIVATFPIIHEDWLEGKEKKKFTVKVITGGKSLTAEDAFTYIKSEKPTSTPFKAELDSSTRQGVVNASVKITANKSVMNLVEEVWFGPYMVEPNSMARSENNTELMVTVPAATVTKTATMTKTATEMETTPTGPKATTKVHVILRFYPHTNISPNDEYVIETPFEYQ